MKKWDVQSKTQNSKLKSQNYSSKLKTDYIIDLLLENRGIKTQKEIDDFLNPKLEDVTIENVGISSKELKKAIKRIKNAIKNQEQIVVFGDYDVDGIAGTAILWETLYKLGAKVLPYIPHRMDEGYGLSTKGIDNVILNSFQDLKKNEMLNQVQHDKKGGLIITVDNGIVANQAVEYANKNGIDVIITDHHVRLEKDPKAHAIVHTTKLCGTGVAWLLSRVILNLFQDLPSEEIPKQVRNDKEKNNDHLGLVALATIADLVPLTGANRTVTKFGIEILKKTNRVGLLELFKEAGVDQKSIDVYTIGHLIAPRLNAMGRLEFAMESLRLLCTPRQERARLLAQLLGKTNRERQVLTQESSLHAIAEVRSKKLEVSKLLFIAHESYQQGVIGLIAGKLVEEFYRPAIVLSIGKAQSKASARSVAGFNIIEFIRSAQEFLVDAGGHPMAAGFTVETAKIRLLEKALHDKIDSVLDKDLLLRTLRIDCELELEHVTQELYSALQKLASFGMGNPEPTFVVRNVEIEDIRLVGKEGKHVKFKFKVQSEKLKVIEGIAFGFGEMSKELKVGDKVDIVYVVDENVWNGRSSIQLKIKDIKNI